MDNNVPQEVQDRAKAYAAASFGWVIQADIITAYIKSWKDAQPVAQPNVQGLQWVKASERLPEQWKSVIVRNLKTGEVKKDKQMGRFDGWWGVGLNHEFQKDNTEWLDESAPVEAPIDPGEFAEWKNADSRFPPKENETVVQYIQRLGRHIVDVELSNRGWMETADKVQPIDFTQWAMKNFNQSKLGEEIKYYHKAQSGFDFTKVEYFDIASLIALYKQSKTNP